MRFTHADVAATLRLRHFFAMPLLRYAAADIATLDYGSICVTPCYAASYAADAFMRHAFMLLAAAPTLLISICCH